MDKWWKRQAPHHLLGVPRVSGGRRKRNVELTTVEFHSQEDWSLLHKIDPLHRFYVGAKLGKPSRRSIPFCLFDLLEVEVAKTFTAHSQLRLFAAPSPFRGKVALGATQRRGSGSRQTSASSRPYSMRASVHQICFVIPFTGTRRCLSRSTVACVIVVDILGAPSTFVT